MDWNSMSDPAILAEIGKRLKEYRLRKNRTQRDVATHAGISVQSLQRLEQEGSVSLSTFISILRMLRLLDNVEALVPELPLSPVELLKLQGKTRKRAAKPHRKKENNGDDS